MMERQSLLRQIDRKVNELASAYASCHGLLLTEDDLKCALYRKLAEIPDLGEPLPTQDPHILAPRLHSELTWFDENNRLGIKPDLTILDPRDLWVGIGSGANVRLPSKGFRFDGEAVLFELKFVRNRNGLTQKAVDALSKDVMKIRRLFNKYERPGDREALLCYFVIFTRVSQVCPGFTALVSAEEAEPRFRFMVKSPDPCWTPCGSLGA